MFEGEPGGEGEPCGGQVVARGADRPPPAARGRLAGPGRGRRGRLRRLVRPRDLGRERPRPGGRGDHRRWPDGHRGPRRPGPERARRRRRHARLRRGPLGHPGTAWQPGGRGHPRDGRPQPQRAPDGPLRRHRRARGPGRRPRGAGLRRRPLGPPPRPARHPRSGQDQLDPHHRDQGGRPPAQPGGAARRLAGRRRAGGGALPAPDQRQLLRRVRPGQAAVGVGRPGDPGRAAHLRSPQRRRVPPRGPQPDPQCAHRRHPPTATPT